MSENCSPKQKQREVSLTPGSFSFYPELRLPATQTREDCVILALDTESMHMVRSETANALHEPGKGKIKFNMGRQEGKYKYMFS